MLICLIHTNKKKELHLIYLIRDRDDFENLIPSMFQYLHS